MVSSVLIKRNIKLFFKDKGMFFTSLITPAILLLLYATFLGNLYQDNFTALLTGPVKLSDDIVDGLVGGQLFRRVSVTWLRGLFAAFLLYGGVRYIL